MASPAPDTRPDDANAPRQFLWGWGQLDRTAGAVVLADRRKLAGPRLIESVQASSLKSLACSASQIVATTHTGTLHRWTNGGVNALATSLEQDLSEAAASPSSSSSSSSALVPDELRKNTISHASCDRENVYAVTASGSVYCWSTAPPLPSTVEEQADEEEEEKTKNEAPPDDASTNTQHTAPSSGSTQQQPQQQQQQQQQQQLPSVTALTFHDGSATRAISRLSCGANFVIAVSSEGPTFSWGDGTHGRLGHGNTQSCKNPRPIMALATHAVSRVSCGWAHSAIVADSGDVYTWGCGRAGRLGLGHTHDIAVPALVSKLTSELVMDVHCGYHHTLARDVNGRCLVWGGNEKGQLGVGDFTTRLEPTLIDIPAADDPMIVTVSCGAFHTAAVTAMGRVLTWGWGKYGQLGHGDFKDRSSPKVVRKLEGLDVTMVCCGGQFTVASSDQFISVQNDYFQDTPTSSPRQPSQSVSVADEPDPESALHATVAVVLGVDKPSARNRTQTLGSAAKVPLPASTPPRLTRVDSASSPLVTVSESSLSNVEELAQRDIAARARGSLFERMFKAFRKKPAVKSLFSSSGAPEATATDATSAPAPPPGDPPSSSKVGRTKTAAATEADAILQEQYRKKLMKDKSVKEKRWRKDKQRQAKEEKQKELRRKQELEREQKIEAATEEWKRNIIPNWNRPKHMNRARDLVWKVGVPAQVRETIWPLCIGNSLMITKDLYNIFGQHARNARMAKDKQKTSLDPMAELQASRLALGKEKTFAYIDVDLHRTFPKLDFFRPGCSMNDDLRNILETFCFYRPDIGYVQGMSYLAGNLLLYMEPYRAFVCFANILNSPFFHAFLKLDPSQMNSRFELFRKLFKDNLPKLYKHFDTENITPDLYFMEWCMTLFSKRLKLEVVGRVWDCYLVFGEAFVYRTAVAILRCCEKKLIKQPFERIMKDIQTLPQVYCAMAVSALILAYWFSAPSWPSRHQDITEKQLFEEIVPVKLPMTLKEDLAKLQRLNT